MMYNMIKLGDVSLSLSLSLLLKDFRSDLGSQIRLLSDVRGRGVG